MLVYLIVNLISLLAQYSHLVLIQIVNNILSLEIIYLLLIYLLNHIYPEIQYSVYQYICFSYILYHSYTIVIKRITYYLHSVFINKNGLCFPKSTDLNLDFFIDTDYTGFWTYKDDQDSVCIESRTSYIVTLDGYPINWTSKL